MRYQLTTKEKVKAKLNIDNADEDTIIDDIIYGVTGTITALIGKELNEKSRTYATEDGTVFLPVTPVTSIETVSDWNGTEYVDRENLPRFKASGEVDLCAGPGFETVKITYTAGYKIDFDNEDDEEQHNLPAEISELAGRLAVRHYRKLEHEGEASTSYETSTTSWQDLVRPEDYDIINNHRSTWI